MQEHEGTTSQDTAEPSHQSSWNEHLSVNGLAMSINIVSRRGRFFARVLNIPKMCSPASEGIRQAFSTASLSNAHQEFLGVSIAVGSLSSRKQGQSITSIAAQVPCAAQLYCTKKEQGQQQPVTGGKAIGVA